MVIKFHSVADVRIFLPKLKDDPADIYAQLYEKDPSKVAKGPIFSFIIAYADDEVLDTATYIQFDNYLEKFGRGYNYSKKVPNLSKEISKKLKIDENLAKDTLLMIQGIFESEAEYIDNAPFSHKWSERYNEADRWYALNRDLGGMVETAIDESGEAIMRFVNFPKNRLYIRIKTNSNNDEDAKIELKDQAISFDDSKLQTALAISTIEVS